MRDHTRRRTWAGGATAAALFFAGLAALFYLPLLLGVATFPDGDFTHHFLPFSLFQQQELRSGRLPLWNPYTYSGHPFLADIQAAVYYPVGTLLLLATLPWDAPGARLYFLQVEAIVQVALAGFFTWLLVRKLTGSGWAALVAGALFALSGYLTGYPPLQLAVLRTATWLPLLLWLLTQAVEAPQRWRWWVGAGATLAVAFLGGHAQTFLLASYTAGTWLLLLLAGRVRTTRAGAPHAAATIALGLLMCGVVAAGLAAAQALPSLEFMQASVRARVDYDFVSGGLPLQDTWQLLLPGVLTHFSPLYIGAVGLGLAWMGAWSLLPGVHLHPTAQAASRLPRTYSVLFFIVLTFIALLLAYGANGFLYPLFYRIVPGWNLFRGQERATYLVAFGLSVLAGYGAAALPAMQLRWRAWLITAFAALAIGGAYLFGLLWQFPGRTAIGQGPFLVMAAVTVALVSALAVMLRWPGWSRRRSFWLAALAVGNLFWANASTNLDAVGPVRKTILAPEVEALQAAVVESAPAGLPGRAYNEFRTYEDYGMRAGVEDVWGASPLRLARYAALFDQFPLDRMWQLLGVEHVLTWRRELFGPSTLLGEWPQATATTYLHRLPDAGPRAWLAGAIRPLSDAEAVRLLGDHTFDLRTTALLPPEAGAVDASVPADPAAAVVELAPVAPGHLRLHVAGGGGILVVAENWMPGWQVQNITCDDPVTPCPPGDVAVMGLPAFTPVRADLTLVGVPLPPGEFTFDLVYAPASAHTGLWITAGTLALLALATAARWLTARRPTP